MVCGEVNPCGVAVAKASLNRAYGFISVNLVVACCRPEAE
jgi:hypothetical protein